MQGLVKIFRFDPAEKKKYYFYFSSFFNKNDGKWLFRKFKPFLMNQFSNSLNIKKIMIIIKMSKFVY